MKWKSQLLFNQLVKQSSYIIKHKLLLQTIKEKKIMNMTRFKPSIQLSFGEEIGNSVSHGVAALAMLIFLQITAIYAFVHFDVMFIVWIFIFTISFILLFFSSSFFNYMFTFSFTYSFI